MNLLTFGCSPPVGEVSERTGGYPTRGESADAERSKPDGPIRADREVCSCRSPSNARPEAGCRCFGGVGHDEAGQRLP